MTNKRSTKRALLASVVSLLLCFTMLLGTTYAWFTDSVTSTNNIIKSGNLDIELEYWNGTAWKDVEGASDILTGDLWEPGYVDVAYLRLKNAGSLALKYQLGVNIVSETEGVNKDGQPFKLSDYIYFDVVEGVDGETEAYKDRDAAMENATEITKISAGYSKAGSLEAKSDYVYLAMIVYMPTTVGNVANHDGKTIPQIDLGINVVATQYTSEEDSFDMYYDGGAAWLGDIDVSWYDSSKAKLTIGSAEQLAGLAALVNGTAPAPTATYALDGGSTVPVDFKGKTITLNADIDLNNVAWTPIGNDANGFCGTFDGNGHTVYNLNVSGNQTIGLFGYALNGGNVKNLTVENATVVAHDYAGAILGRGYTDIDNCHVKNVTVITTPYQKADGTYDGGAKAGGVIGQMLEGSGNTVKNCSATDVKIYGFRDIGGVVGMVHNNNSASDNTATNVTLGYILLDKITADKNENAGAIYGRVQSTATVSPAKDSEENQAYTLVYAVYDVDTLTSLANYVNKEGRTFKDETVVMIDDIDLAGVNWTPIGRVGITSTDFTYAFSGTFDGQNHKVYNLNVSNEGWAGLFGLVYKGYINNVSVVGAVINSNRMTGGIVGQLYGNLDNCHVTDAKITVVPNAVGDSYDNGDKVGGIVGWIGDNNNNRILKNCSVKNATIKAYRDIGGIAGYVAYSTTVSNNSVADIEIIVDQVTNNYGDKDYNAKAIWGRNSESNGVGVTASNNVEENVTVAAVASAGVLNNALANGGNVILTADVANNNETVSNAYGKTGYTQTNGGVLDGNGYTMTVTGANGTWDSAINTTGGTIKNITVTGAFRGIFINHNSTHSEKVILENVIIDGTTYTISCDQGTNQGLKATNCTFNGWTSYAATLGAAEFINCTFGEGRGYAYCRPYADTTFTNCVFEEGYEFDATHCSSTFINCYVGDTLITSENVVALLGANAANIVVQNG